VLAALALAPALAELELAVALVLELVLVLELELVHPAAASRPAVTAMTPGLEALQML
jgi:hypothetical protein